MRYIRRGIPLAAALGASFGGFDGQLSVNAVHVPISFLT